MLNWIGGLLRRERQTEAPMDARAAEALTDIARVGHGGCVEFDGDPGAAAEFEPVFADLEARGLITRQPAQIIVLTDAGARAAGLPASKPVLMEAPPALTASTAPVPSIEPSSIVRPGSAPLPEVVETRKEKAVADLRTFTRPTPQSCLPARWGVSKATVSDWLGDWEKAGLVRRVRHGRECSVQFISKLRVVA